MLTTSRARLLLVVTGVLWVLVAVTVAEARLQGMSWPVAIAGAAGIVAILAVGAGAVLLAMEWVSRGRDS